MAISASAVWEVRTAGSDANGGLYISGGTDYSQQDAAQLSVADAVTNGTTTVTSATGGFTSAMIGNGINVAGSIRQITAVASTNSIAVDALIASATGQAAKVGGALASPGMAAGFTVGGNDVWMRGGTYPITSTTANVSGGRVVATGNVAGNPSRWEGYATTRGDKGTPPVLQASGISAVTVFTSTFDVITDNIKIDGASLASVVGFSTHVLGHAVRCVAYRCATGFSNTDARAGFTRCLADSCGIGFFTAGYHDGCESRAHTVVGFRAAGSNGYKRCLAWGGATAGAVGFDANSQAVEFADCTAHGQSGDGFKFLAVRAGQAVNCVAYGNGGYGFNGTGGAGHYNLHACASGSNTAGRTVGTLTDEGSVLLTVDPFVNAAAGNFTLNATAGGGSALRGVGTPGTFPGSLTTGYPDIGAVQSQATSGTRAYVG